MDGRSKRWMNNEKKKELRCGCKWQPIYELNAWMNEWNDRRVSAHPISRPSQGGERDRTYDDKGPWDANGTRRVTTRHHAGKRPHDLSGLSLCMCIRSGPCRFRAASRPYLWILKVGTRRSRSFVYFFASSLFFPPFVSFVSWSPCINWLVRYLFPPSLLSICTTLSRGDYCTPYLMCTWSVPLP